jgi:hypothetical protein
MIFSPNTEVFYNQLYGKINFICENYLIIELPAVTGRKPARLIVFPENYKRIELVKASTK